MNEQEWLECTYPTAMLGYLGGTASNRKVRLFTVACCRSAWDRLVDDRSRRAVDVAEMFADGIVSETKAAAAADDAWNFRDELFDSGANQDPKMEETLQLANAAALTACQNDLFSGGIVLARIEPTTQCSLFRDIFGNPFRPITIDPRWLTSNVVDLATAIYDERAFERMPILADALMDAGCDDEEIIAHCRGPGPHVRGCWLVDLLLGKQ